VVLEGDEAWLVLVTPGSAGTGWSAARLRLASPVPVAAGRHPGSAVVTVIAAQLVQGAFRTLTGAAAPPGGARLARIRLDSLRSEEHRFLPHPYALAATATTADALRRQVAALAAGPRLSETEFSRRAARCVDDRLGIFGFTDHDWAQVPLPVAGAVVADPVGLLVGPARPIVVGAAFEFETARCQAALGALASYSARMVDLRRLVDPDTGAPLPAADDPATVLAAVRAGTMPAAVWGCVLGESALDDPAEVRLVPAAAAFPALPYPAGHDGATPAGFAAGYDWREAVLSGLLAQCRDRTVAEIGSATTPYPRVDLAAAPLDDSSRRCWSLLAELGELPEVYDLAGSLGVPTFAFCRGTSTITVTAGATAASALASGLRQVLLGVQARVHGQPQYAPQPPAALPVRLRGGRVRELDQRPPLDPVEVAARLRSCGRVAVVVPLDHDPGVVEVMPYLVRVVLEDA
jgi:hypothetical protein